jgi:hypothetical protein
MTRTGVIMDNTDQRVPEHMELLLKQARQVIEIARGLAKYSERLVEAKKRIRRSDSVSGTQIGRRG